jgi:SAM-dependent methyltransferase
MNKQNLIESESKRIRAEYHRRTIEVDGDLYAHWQPGEILMISDRERVAALLLKKLEKFPMAGDRCMEIGYGKLGWLGRMISWGMRESDLYGIELDEDRAAVAKRALPNANLIVGNAAELPWKSNFFRIVIASTLFSSILDEHLQMLIAREIDRVLMPGGVLLWYDAAVDNPRNVHLRGISRSEICRLFPEYSRHLKSVTLAPPMARRVAGLSWTIASILSAIPFLRTHLIGALVKV